MTALGFVHVVRRDQHARSRGRKTVDALPKLATADRIYAGGRLVEKQKAWFMKCGAGQGNPLLEASRQRSGQLSAPLDQTVFSQGPSDARPACRSRKPIHPSVE